MPLFALMNITSLGPLPDFVIPRTQRFVPGSGNIAKNPQEFASVLIQKLEAVKKERDTHERVQQSFKKIHKASLLCAILVLLYFNTFAQLLKMLQ